MKTEKTAIEKYRSKLTGDKETNYSLSRATRKTKRSSVQNPAVRNHDKIWARQNRQKAEAFADQLSKIFQPHDRSQHELPMGIDDVNIELALPGE